MSYVAAWIFIGWCGAFIKWCGDCLVDYRWDQYDVLVNIIAGAVGGIVWFFFCIWHFIAAHKRFKCRFNRTISQNSKNHN
jgi:hypothetical protein